MDAATAAAELEEDQRVRLEELTFLENICGNLAESEGDRMRRSMLLMLYAHFEGFTKTTLEIYRRHINEASLVCSDVQPELATSALHHVFKAIRDADNAQSFLPANLQGLTDLRSIAVERTLVAETWALGQRPVALSDKYIDLESNLKPVVLRKNLYRLGLPHAMFDQHESTVGQLLGRRNNIAHGAEVIGVDIVTYERMRDAVYDVMSDLRLKIIEAITTQAYLQPVAAATA